MTNLEVIEYQKIIFEQVKHQQDIRDRWVKIYLTIVGVIGALIVSIVKLFGTKGYSDLFIYLLIIILLNLYVIGFLFFMLYIKQRLNYLKLINKLKHTERKLDDKLIYNEDENSQNNSIYSFTNRMGADFYTIYIHILINSMYFSLFILSIYFGIYKIIQFGLIEIIVVSIAYISSIVFSEIIRRKNFNIK